VRVLNAGCFHTGRNWNLWSKACFQNWTGSRGVAKRE
jgi:hypothetical protein